ncbi:unnamed protein product [Sphagnum tenellum]
MPGSATRLLNARPRSGGISCDGGFGWSGAAGLNGLAANAASSVSWPKDSDHRRLSSDNGAVESSSSSSAVGGAGLSSSDVSSRSSSSSCSAASFSCRVQESKSRGRRRRISNLAWYSQQQQQQLGYSCGIIKQSGYYQGSADCLLMTITSLSSSSSSSSSHTCLETTSTIQLAGTRNPSALLCGGFASRSCCGAMGFQGSGLLSLPLGLKRVQQQQQKRRNTHTNHSQMAPVHALGTSGQDKSDDMKKMGEAGEMQEALEGKWHAELSHATRNTVGDQSEASWEQMGMVFRVVYAIAMYGGLAFAGSLICNFTGVDLWGGFDLSPQVITTGFGYAVPPMMVLLFILEDEIVKNCGAARAIRDVEDEELMDFFVGMSPWQFPFVVAAGAVAEELFFRVSIQGGLAHAFQVSDKGMSETTIGLVSLTGVIPIFVPFAHLFAAVLTAALTGSMYYVISSPKDPKYVVAPAIHGCNNRRDIKARVEAWYARRQQKKIYSPLVESLLALYLGFEWMHTGNILAPIITHTLYSLVIVGNGLRRIHDNRAKLRQRLQQKQKEDKNIMENL